MTTDPHERELTPGPEAAPLNGREAAGQKPENPLVNVMLNVLVPTLILSHLSKEEGFLALGPTWAIVVAVSIPIGYGIYYFATFKKANLFSVLGFISVVLTGGLGLMETTAIWFALKEAIIPLIFGFAVLLSHYWMKKPLARLFLLNPEMFDVPRIEGQIDTEEKRMSFRKTMTTSTWLMAGSFFVSTCLNFMLWMILLDGKTGGTTAYSQAIGKGTWMGFLVIGIPALIIMIYAWFRMMNDLEKLTGLTKDEMLLPR